MLKTDKNVIHEDVEEKTIKTKYHIYFWMTYFLFNVIRWGSYFNDYWYSFRSNLVEFPLHLVIVYFNINYLIPNYLLKKKYTMYVTFLLLSLGVHYVVRSGLNYWLITENIWPEAQGENAPFGLNHIIAVVLGELYVLALTFSIKISVDFILERNKTQQLTALQYKTELQYLKAQIQPHFFFNTLNNLYALTIQKSSKASDVVVKLSEFMQYIIYDASKKKVSLIQEIQYIDNYIELENIRYGNQIKTEINIVGCIDDVLVTPLLFLPFVENAFKHGFKDTGEMSLLVSFEVYNDTLIFVSENSYGKEASSNSKNGIGIKNVERRLQLLYNENYELIVSNDNNLYKITLKIPTT
ncbi:Histidine kinase [Aquimarina amphilecti]|uniref:Histidine kinase n=1 Tax=Aquimarina amphilecti TaxID=1038014 RepID=A0A1H7L5C2_AQUAM|nr:histidine kinase [Aquimarina amphilecti]SEK94034.1 Histidine kinase [Aquimarina amphilecti]